PACPRNAGLGIDDDGILVDESLGYQRSELQDRRGRVATGRSHESSRADFRPVELRQAIDSFLQQLRVWMGHLIPGLVRTWILETIIRAEIHDRFACRQASRNRRK